MISLLNQDNMTFETDQKFDVIFADYVYENIDFCWVKKYFQYLKPNSIFIAMTDFHSDYRYRAYMEDEVGAIFINHLVWLNEWGNHPKNRFHQCYDDILVYSNGNNWNFYSDKIQVDKATKNKGLNPSGRMTKTATAWISDICLTTTSLERVKKKDGHLVRWQKPIRLFDRIILPFIGDDNDSLILDPFMGSGSLGDWCVKNGCDYIGIENDKEVFELAKRRIESER